MTILIRHYCSPDNHGSCISRHIGLFAGWSLPDIIIDVLHFDKAFDLSTLRVPLREEILHLFGNFSDATH